MTTYSEKFLRRRKFLIVLPVLVLPFMTLAFWALGGGKGTSNTKAQQQQGLNTALPGAQLSGGALDKMSLYNQAAKDSLALQEQLKNDPYAPEDSMSLADIDSLPNEAATAPDYGTTGSGLKHYPDPNEARVRAKLAELEASLNQPLQQQTDPYMDNSFGDASPDLERLRQMIQATNENGNTDAETQQLNELMEKILDIQYPGRAQEKLRQQSRKNRGRVYGVGKEPISTEAALLKRPVQDMGAADTAVQPEAYARNGFYDLSELSVADTGMQIAIPAVVHETQTVVSGASVKLRLTEDVYINGVLIPKNNFVHGTCMVSGERLKIEVSGIRYRNNLFPVALSVYDLDAIEGVRIPGAITRDAAKEGSERAIQGIGFTSLDPSIGAQAAGAGIEAVKGLFGKKAKLIRVTVKAGYPVLLMDEKAKQEAN